MRYSNTNKSEIQVRGITHNGILGEGANFFAHGLHMGNGEGCPWATRENFAIKSGCPVGSPLHPNMKKGASQ